MDLVRLSQFVQGRGLLAITVEDWILIQRSSFDLHIDDLPYHAIQVYVKVTSRSYVVRDGHGVHQSSLRIVLNKILSDKITCTVLFREFL